MRVLSVPMAGLLLMAIATGCLPTVAPRQPATVTVAAVVMPQGAAPPETLTLYQAAMEMNRAPDREFDLRVLVATPQMPQPGAVMRVSPGQSPSVAALEQTIGQDPPPDIILFSNLWEFGIAAEKGLVQPLDPYLRSDRTLKREDFFPGALEAVTDQGELYGLPISVAPTLLQYDRRLFEAAGLPPPSAEWDWATFLDAAKRLTKGGDGPDAQYGVNLYGSTNLPAMFIWQGGGEVLSKDGRRALLTEPAALEGLKFLSDLLYVHKVSPTPKKGEPGRPVAMPVRAVPVAVGEAPPLMGPGGRVAMQFMSGMAVTRGWGMYWAGEDWPLRLAEPPRGKAQATWIDVQGVLGLTSRARNPRIAYRALAQLTAEMGKSMPIPARRDAARNLRQMAPQLTEADAQLLVRVLEYGRSLPAIRQQQYMSAFNQKLVQPLMENSKPVAEAAREAADAMEQAINQDPTAEGTPTPGSVP